MKELHGSTALYFMNPHSILQTVSESHSDLKSLGSGVEIKAGRSGDTPLLLPHGSCSPSMGKSLVRRAESFK